jgi:hypothetical protein
VIDVAIDDSRFTRRIAFSVKKDKNSTAGPFEANLSPATGPAPTVEAPPQDQVADFVGLLLERQ